MSFKQTKSAEIKSRLKISSHIV